MRPETARAGAACWSPQDAGPGPVPPGPSGLLLAAAGFSAPAEPALDLSTAPLRPLPHGDAALE